MCACVCVCVEKFCAQRSLHVAIQCVKSSLRSHTNPKIATCLELGRFGLWPGAVWTAGCLCTPTSLYPNTCFQCSNKMPFIKVSQSRLEDLIELVRQCLEIYDATHPDPKDAVKTAKTLQYKIISSHLPQCMETGTPHTNTHTHIRRRSLKAVQGEFDD